VATTACTQFDPMCLGGSAVTRQRLRRRHRRAAAASRGDTQRTTLRFRSSATCILPRQHIVEVGSTENREVGGSTPTLATNRL
jgi:hypothetical protein